MVLTSVQRYRFEGSWGFWGREEAAVSGSWGVVVVAAEAAAEMPTRDFSRAPVLDVKAFMIEATSSTFAGPKRVVLESSLSCVELSRWVVSADIRTERGDERGGMEKEGERGEEDERDKKWGAEGKGRQQRRRLEKEVNSSSIAADVIRIIVFLESNDRDVGISSARGERYFSPQKAKKNVPRRKNFFGIFLFFFSSSYA